MIKFTRIRESNLKLLSEGDFAESDYFCVLDLLNISFEYIFVLICEEDEEKELFTLIEENGKLKQTEGDFQLFYFDDKSVVLYNSFEDTIIFCNENDIEELQDCF